MASRLVKLLRALDLLSQPSGATIKEIAEHFGISDRKSVYRLLDLIQQIGIPLYQEDTEGREKRWKLVESYVKKFPNFTAPSIDLTFPEIIALYLLRGEMRIGRETEIQKRMDSAFKKINQLVPAGLSSQLGKISSLFASSAKYIKDYSQKEEIIDSCTDAMLGRRTCYVKYHAFYDDKTKDFKIDPLCFFENNGGLYVFVRATTFGDIRTLAIERIEEITPTESVFEYPEGFNPQALLDSAFDIVFDDPIEVKIWISADQARYVKEREWAKGQVITDLPDGSINLEMKTSGWWHVKKWVLSFGAEAKVLEPEELKKAVAAELEEALKGYTGIPS